MIGGRDLATQRYFLAFSNSRCGSTFLQTSLARLPGIATDFELFWEGPNPVMKGDPPYAFSVTNDWNWKEFLETKLPPVPIAGTRVILHPMKDYAPEEAQRFIANIDRDILIIHTIRDYFDILKSSRVRDHITWVSDDQLDRSSAKDPSLGETELWASLRKRGLREIDGWKNEGRPFLEESSRFVLRFFINDLVMAEIARRAERSMLIEFEGVWLRFHEIADFLGCDCTKEDCDAIIHNPVTKRLPPVPDEELPNWQALKELCGILNDTIRNALDSDISLFAAWKEGRLNLPQTHVRNQ